MGATGHHALLAEVREDDGEGGSRTPKAVERLGYGQLVSPVTGLPVDAHEADRDGRIRTCVLLLPKQAGWPDSPTSRGAPGEIQTPDTLGRSQVLCSLSYGGDGTDGQIRTDTGQGLGLVPLPVGLRRQDRWSWRESNPRERPCKGRRLAHSATP